MFKALGRSKTVICNYLKTPNKYGRRKPTGRRERLSPQFKRRIICEVEMKTSSTLKILKSLEDAPCSVRAMRRQTNNETIKHKKRIHCLRLTMKHKEKRLEYKTMSTKEWQKSCFLRRKEIQFRRSRWLSEVLARIIFSKRELLKKA